MYQFESATEAFETLYGDIQEFGIPYSNTKATFNCVFDIINPYDHVVESKWRGFNPSYAEFEYQWYKTGNRDATEISKRAPIWKNHIVPGTTEVNSNYGWFWNYDNQLYGALDLFKQDPYTRRAYVSHYHLDELDRYQSDTPCNVGLNFYQEDGELNLTVMARSIDLWYGFCNDVYCFSKLLIESSQYTGFETGKLTYFITNLHLYDGFLNKQ